MEYGAAPCVQHIMLYGLPDYIQKLNCFHNENDLGICLPRAHRYSSDLILQFHLSRSYTTSDEIEKGFKICSSIDRVRVFDDLATKSLR